MLNPNKSFILSNNNTNPYLMKNFYQIPNTSNLNNKRILSKQNTNNWINNFLNYRVMLMNNLKRTVNFKVK